MITSLKKMIRFNPLTLSILLILSGIFIYLIEIPFIELMELKTIDLRYVSRGGPENESDVVLAVIDEESIDKEGKWIWPRSKMANLVDKLSAAGARVISFDVGFLEPDEKSVIKTIEDIEKNLTTLDDRNRAYLEELKQASDNDQLLADAIAESKAKVVLGYFFQMEKLHSGDLDEELLKIQRKNIQSSRYNQVKFRSEKAMDIPLIEAQVANANITTISQTTPYSGFFNMFPDRDGVVRWIPAIIDYSDEMYAPLSLMTLSAFKDTQPLVVVAEYGIEKIQFDDIEIPTDELGRIMINYRGDAKSFRHIPVTDILNDKVPENELKGKAVIVGATAIGIYDMRVTPFASVFPGVEIHASIVDSALRGEFLYHPTWAAVFDILAIVLAGLLLGVVLPRAGVFSGVFTVGVLFFGHILFCQYLFSRQGWILNMVYPLMVILAVYISITVYRYLSESRQKRFIRSAFSTYLAPTVVQQLIDSPENLELGGEEREITAFFSDVQGFTSISEELTPHELVELLNEFLTEMTNIILKHEGTVDKFEGDAIIAFYGAPNALENQAETACLTCVDMQKRLGELREKWHQEGKPELKMRIGLSTGPAVVGNMGSRHRMDYTMMGDTVNTAARLEGVNKIYGIYTLVCETTFKKARQRVWGREIDAINVIGKAEPVTVYQVLSYSEDIDETMLKMTGLYAEGLHLYRQRHWGAAIEKFDAALNISPDDGPSKAMRDRCASYKKKPPPQDWNGSYSMKTK
ncbi:MAG: adenylate/guanylate cyclase domain-containing protein [Desulfobacterales bacterium]|nr:adenylate/guanylate cyclase domain-containing protein [Desulfobacterales bacterium]MDX2512353.1 adenylate/guanylate cyclase domain-containing protein [Desulfobacterales bacterium]